MSHVNITAFEQVEIERDVLLGSGVKIWDTDFHPVDFNSRMANTRPQSRAILIREGAFIGACSIIKVWMLF